MQSLDPLTGMLSRQGGHHVAQNSTTVTTPTALTSTGPPFTQVRPLILGHGLPTTEAEAIYPASFSASLSATGGSKKCCELCCYHSILSALFKRLAEKRLEACAATNQMAPLLCPLLPNPIRG